jgi:hypothetical protein
MSDVVLDGDAQVTVLCENLNVQGHDLLLDAPARRRAGGPQFRRALVHDGGDGLTVNFGNDYPGGVSLNGVAGITPLGQPHVPGLRRKPDLVVHGGITYEVEGLALVGGGAPTITVSVDEEFGKLNQLIADLTARVAKLEAH